MASILKVDDLRGNTSAGDITITGEGGTGTIQLQQGLSKAWCKFGNDAQPDDSFNISSGTDVNTGRWRFAKTNLMNNTNYTVVGTNGSVIDGFTTGHNSNAVESTTNHSQSKYDGDWEDFQASPAGYGMHNVNGDLA